MRKRPEQVIVRERVEVPLCPDKFTVNVGGGDVVLYMRPDRLDIVDSSDPLVRPYPKGQRNLPYINRDGNWYAVMPGIVKEDGFEVPDGFLPVMSTSSKVDEPWVISSSCLAYEHKLRLLKFALPYDAVKGVRVFTGEKPTLPFKWIGTTTVMEDDDDPSVRDIVVDADKRLWLQKDWGSPYLQLTKDPATFVPYLPKEARTILGLSDPDASWMQEAKKHGWTPPKE